MTTFWKHHQSCLLSSSAHSSCECCLMQLNVLRKESVLDIIWIATFLTYAISIPTQRLFNIHSRRPASLIIAPRCFLLNPKYSWCFINSSWLQICLTWQPRQDWSALSTCTNYQHFCTSYHDKWDQDDKYGYMSSMISQNGSPDKECETWISKASHAQSARPAKHTHWN